MNLNDNPRGGCICLAKAGLKLGNSDAKDVDIAAPNGDGVDFAINGVLYHAADAADIAISATTVQAVDTTCLYLIQLSTAGALTSVKGTEVTTLSLAAGDSVLKIPEPTEGTCPIGMLAVVTVAVTFTGGTTDLNASGVTTTYQDIMTLPPEPLTAAF